MTPDPLPADLVRALERAGGRTAPFGRSVHFFHEVGSTNEVAARLAERGAPEGTIVLAESQTAGRGRLGREWHSPAGAGLYVSLVCRNATAAPFLTLAGGVAAAEAVRTATGLPVEIKWPNDIVVSNAAASGQRRKLAGILAEGATAADGLQFVILGFGINVRPASLPPSVADRATSLEAELGRPVDSQHLLIELLAAFARLFSALAAANPAVVLDRWRALAPSAAGARVTCQTGHGRCDGITAGIADDGALLVRTGSTMERVVAGEIVWR
ncbi:MAG TPA: biotin--[acetyl-CoA-carboxylase] ligase [Vicinamibacterales bacterium]|nr:biotin--[acetyl-CoA-carboxylase] ligase [Vicinamibacterales bacterium]